MQFDPGEKNGTLKKFEEQLILCAFIAVSNAARSPEVATELQLSHGKFMSARFGAMAMNVRFGTGRSRVRIPPSRASRPRRRRTNRLPPQFGEILIAADGH